MKDLGIFWEEPSLFVTGFSARAAGRAVIKGSGLEKRAVLILLPYSSVYLFTEIILIDPPDVQTTTV